jgi:hypothetical protein
MAEPASSSLGLGRRAWANWWTRCDPEADRERLVRVSGNRVLIIWSSAPVAPVENARYRLGRSHPGWSPR